VGWGSIWGGEIAHAKEEREGRRRRKIVVGGGGGVGGGGEGKWVPGGRKVSRYHGNVSEGTSPDVEKVSVN